MVFYLSFLHLIGKRMLGLGFDLVTCGLRGMLLVLSCSSIKLSVEIWEILYGSPLKRHNIQMIARTNIVSPFISPRAILL